MTGNGRGGSSPLLSTKKHHSCMVFFYIYKNKPNSVPWEVSQGMIMYLGTALLQHSLRANFSNFNKC